MTNAAKYLIPVAFVLLAILLLRVINLKKEYRGRQILAVYLSPVISITGVVIAYIFFDKIDVLNNIVSIENSPLYGAAILIWNAIIVVAYLLIKLILCPIMKSVWAKRSSMETTSDTWYEFDEDNSAWFLKVRYRNTRSFFNVMSWVMGLICAAILTLNAVFGQDGSTWLKVFPIAALIVVTEIYNFLTGYTKPEYLHSIDGEDIGSSRLGAYYKLRKTYESLFPSALLVSHTGNEFVGKESATDLLLKYQDSDDPVERVVGDYYAHLKKKDGLFDVDLVSMTNTLLHGESSVVFNPFYRDLGEYLLLPIVHNLVNNRKCLIIVGRSSLCTDVIDWAKGILKEYSRTRSLWRVDELSKDNPDCEVGVLSFSQIYDSSIINSNASFFQEVGFTGNFQHLYDLLLRMFYCIQLYLCFVKSQVYFNGAQTSGGATTLAQS